MKFVLNSKTSSGLSKVVGQVSFFTFAQNLSDYAKMFSRVHGDAFAQQFG